MALFLRQRNETYQMLDFLIWLDIQIFRLITFGNCKKGETISAAAWDLLLEDKWQGRVFVPIIDALFYFVQKDHCRNAWLWQIDLYRKV